jgi:hypothetical protein
MKSKKLLVQKNIKKKGKKLYLMVEKAYEITLVSYTQELILRKIIISVQKI